MNAVEVQTSLGKAMTKLNKCLETGQCNEKDLKLIQTMCSVAKQLICNADIIIRASKLTDDKEACKGLLKHENN